MDCSTQSVMYTVLEVTEVKQLILKLALYINIIEYDI